MRQRLSSALSGAALARRGPPAVRTGARRRAALQGEVRTFPVQGHELTGWYIIALLAEVRFRAHFFGI